jgi:hypothetical protein
LYPIIESYLWFKRCDSQRRLIWHGMFLFLLGVLVIVLGLQQDPDRANNITGLSATDNIVTATSGTMTGDQSRLLKVGDRVCWGATTTDVGTVIGTSWSEVTISWDDGEASSVSHNDMAKVERVPRK